MQRLLILLLLAATLAVNVASQSGRRGRTPAATETAPVQPPLNKEPEPEPRPAARAELRSLPASLLEKQIKALDKSIFRLADFHNKVVVINLWASWCGPCRREIPEYEKVRKAYLGRDVEFIGLTTEDPNTTSDRVKRFLRDVSFGFRLGWADRELASTLRNGVNAIPQTFVIDADGRIVSHWVGYAPGQGGDRLRQMIERALHP